MAHTSYSSVHWLPTLHLQDRLLSLTGPARCRVRLTGGFMQESASKAPPSSREVAGWPSLLGTEQQMVAPWEAVARFTSSIIDLYLPRLIFWSISLS